MWLQTLILGTVFSLCATIGDSLVAIAAAGAGGGLRQRLADAAGISRVAGVVYIALGVAAALSDGRSRA